MSNILMQILTGIPLEAGHGCWRVLGVYIASVLGGSMSIAALSSHCRALVGASAGAYGLLGAHFSTIILNWSEMEYRGIRLFIIVIFVAVDIFLCIFNPITSLGNSTITHVAGFVLGFLVGVVLVRNLKVRFWETRLVKVCLALFIVIVVILLSLIVFVANFDLLEMLS